MSFLLTDWFGDKWTIAITSSIDILIVYYAIYRVLLTIKGTRAAQMVIGMVLLRAVAMVAERLEMSIVSLVLDSFFNQIIIIVIVLFQQDIRRGLMRIGQNMVPFGKTHQLTHAFDEVLAAAQHLAKVRMGGIVVFERDADLKPFLDAGKAIDGLVSKELLVSLFVPSRDNELHDGAVIINKNLRIERAGVLLPLSRSGVLSQEFGTRHRAGLGITEETDAVALVISEERGEISLCVKGTIARDLEIDTLTKALQDLFDEEPTSEVAAVAAGGVEETQAPAPPKAAVPLTETTMIERPEKVEKAPLSRSSAHVLSTQTRSPAPTPRRSQTLDRAENLVDRAHERPAERAAERASERAAERPGERAAERPAESQGERKVELKRERKDRPGGKDRGAKDRPESLMAGRSSAHIPVTQRAQTTDRLVEPGS